MVFRTLPDLIIPTLGRSADRIADSNQDFSKIPYRKQDRNVHTPMPRRLTRFIRAPVILVLLLATIWAWSPERRSSSSGSVTTAQGVGIRDDQVASWVSSGPARAPDQERGVYGPLPVGPFRLIRDELERRADQGDATAAMIQHLSVDACGQHRPVEVDQRDDLIARGIEFRLDFAQQLLALEEDEDELETAIETMAGLDLDETRRELRRRCCADP